jgi:hypothetical protein
MFTCPFTVNLNCDSVWSVMWTSLGDCSLPIKGGALAGRSSVSILLETFCCAVGSSERTAFLRPPCLRGWRDVRCVFVFAWFFGGLWIIFLFISCSILYARPSARGMCLVHPWLWKYDEEALCSMLTSHPPPPSLAGKTHTDLRWFYKLFWNMPHTCILA